MINRTDFDLMKARHGGYGSWAVWSPQGERPKSNVADLTIFDLSAHPSVLETLRRDVVMVGLNISRPVAEPFRNFHDSNPRANDFKIRFAFWNTPYYGAYMTDIIKNVEIGKSKDLLRHLKDVPELIPANIASFRQELRDLGSLRPTILAFGAAAHALIRGYLPSDNYLRLIKLTHYSHQMGKEQYRKAVLREIGAAGAEDLAGVTG